MMPFVIQDEVSERPCISHHHACDCREQKIATLIKAALDAAMELDWMKNIVPASEEEIDQMRQIALRVYAACEEAQA